MGDRQDTVTPADAAIATLDAYTPSAKSFVNKHNWGVPKAVLPLQVDVNGFAVSNPQTAVYDSPTLDSDADLMVEVCVNVTPDGLAPNIRGNLGYVQAVVEWRSAESSFQGVNAKTLRPIGQRVRRLPVRGSHVRVTVSWVNAVLLASLNTPAIQVNLSIGQRVHEASPAEWLCPEWVKTAALNVPGGLYGGTAAQAVSGALTSGVILGTRISLDAAPTGAGATKCYVMAFDSAAAPVANAIPIWSSKPLLASGDWDSFDDEIAAGGLEWDKELWVALSSTAGIYTPVGAGGAFTFDLKQGN